jgi:hypothetical protein
MHGSALSKMEKISIYTRIFEAPLLLFLGGCKITKYSEPITSPVWAGFGGIKNPLPGKRDVFLRSKL